MGTFTVQELADLVSGRVEGDGSRRIAGVAPANRAGPGDVTYVVSRKYAQRLERCQPGAVILPPGIDVDADGAAIIRVPNPELAFSKVTELFFPPRESTDGVHPTAILGRGVRLGEGVSVGPFVTIDEGAEIGRDCVICAHSHIGPGVLIGESCWIGPSCTIHEGAVLGDRVRLHSGVRLGVDGFGYAPTPDGLRKIPQVGKCIIGDDVEIGANSTIDRGSLGDTVIGEGTKIDNLVHIAHNVTVGRHCVIVAQVGIAGSVEVGDGAQLAGQAGIAGHLTIGPGARIGAQAGVIGDVPAGADYSGYPARPHRQSLRASAAAARLPELQRRLVALERDLGRPSE